MIVLSLGRAPESAIEFDALFRGAVRAVFAALADGDYTIDPEHPREPEPGRELHVSHEYRVEPGPALLAVSADAFTGRVQFVLDGPRFGFDFADTRNDPLTWMRLVTLGVQYAEHHGVAAAVSDPQLGFDPRPGAAETPDTQGGIGL